MWQWIADNRGGKSLRGRLSKAVLFQTPRPFLAQSRQLSLALSIQIPKVAPVRGDLGQVRHAADRLGDLEGYPFPRAGEEHHGGIGDKLVLVSVVLRYAHLLAVDMCNEERRQAFLHQADVMAWLGKVQRIALGDPIHQAMHNRRREG